ncbi:MAG: ASPIC/UnbV domain protein, partial [Verrucomicrobiales bacterium]|nr:ASPIC/UnbV domain protein [Verrucomicrobiales bacterium]
VLIIGTGRGGKTAFYRNDQHGFFALRPNSVIAPADQVGVVGWSSRGTNRFLVAQSNYEGGGRNMSSVVEYDRNLKLFDLINGQTPSAGPLGMGDLDGDGDMDLFVGSRQVPGHFPEPCLSRLYRNHFGQFRLDRSLSTDLSSAGMVSGAVFSDLDSDGKPELLLACDCGPIRVFRYNGRNFVEDTDRLGFAMYVGRWNGISTGDFDGDGRMDIIASNWGRNSKFQRFMEKPLELYYGNLNRDGRTAIIEAFFDSDSKNVVPWRSYVSIARALPFLPQKFPTYKTFAQLSVAELLEGRMAGVRKLEINTVDTMLFLNRGDHFESRALPPEAQFAPAFGISIADFDGDGAEDIFLSQNFFAVTTETSRFDAGRGLLLKGDGHGTFAAMTGEQSGLLVYGEQRGCAAADFDHDGRVDLVVSQNAAETRLFRNTGAKPGLRIVLKGSRENPQGIGAKIRLFTGETAGPAREIHAGSGYWSQEGAVQVMSSKGRPTKVSVQWPGGVTSVYPIPEGSSIVEAAAP